MTSTNDVNKQDKQNFYKLISQKKATVAIVGIGHIGTILAKSVSSVGFKTIGFDIDKNKIDLLNAQGFKLLSATTDFWKIKNCDIICICAPTPIDENRKPDLSAVKSASETIAKFLSNNQLVVLESSVAPGTTRDVVLPILESTGLTEGTDFILAYSPERVDPGNQTYGLKNTPKVISAFQIDGLDIAVKFYSYFVDNLVPVSSVEIAEMSKMLENVFRCVNIALINELADYSLKKNIDIWEVISAASTKPYGFLAHYPGPGTGGHCIPVDPEYLIDDAQNSGVSLDLIRQALEINYKKPRLIFEKALQVINGNGSKNGHTPKILLVGVSYKKGVDDIRESPALKIWQFAKENGLEVVYHDPFVPKINGSTSQTLSEKLLSEIDVIIVTTDHPNISYQKIANSGKPILDTRNVFLYTHKPHVIKI